MQRLLQSLNRLPLPLQRFLRVLRGPRSPIFKLYLLVTGARPTPIPPPTELPDEPRRVYIAPVNAAEQAKLWAATLQEHLSGVGARNMMAPVVGGSIFEATEPVPLGAFHLSRRWQRAEFERAAEFTHVLVESQEAMFGGLLRYDPAREISALRGRGLSVAALSHGSDTRSPSAHAERTPWSPFREHHPETAMLQHIADKNRARLARMRLPVFVSTPDLLDDLPDAHWCPLIVEPVFRSVAAEPLLRERLPIVTHIPSRGWLKGTELVEPVAGSLAERGIIAYRPLEGVPRERMAQAYASADILLEQFRLGSYGATAVEAMAAGRVVVGHVLPSVREHVLRATGLELPVVEATPDVLGTVVERLVGDPDRMREIGERGRQFVDAVHDGRMSAASLAEHWIDRG